MYIMRDKTVYPLSNLIFLLCPNVSHEAKEVNTAIHAEIKRQGNVLFRAELFYRINKRNNTGGKTEELK